MLVELGEIEVLFRYPVKSMAGESLEVANLGWQGIEGDRRLGLRRVEDRGDFPWLSASRLPDLVLFTTINSGKSGVPTHVRTPDGQELPVFSNELAAEIKRRHGSAVEMMQMRHGIFDDGALSVIASTTVEEISRLAGHPSDVRRFRPNVVVRSSKIAPFDEDQWVGGVLTFGEGADAPAISVTMRDLRCSMLNIDPDSAKLATEFMKAVVRMNENNAGIYGTVIRTGKLAVGQKILLRASERVASTAR